MRTRRQSLDEPDESFEEVSLDEDSLDEELLEDESEFEDPLSLPPLVDGLEDLRA